MQATKVNVYAENHGWLFEDLKQQFKTLHCIPGFDVSVSDRPLATADAWVALRTKEAAVSPDIRRTVVCVHDLFSDDGMYQQGGSRQALRDAAALVLSHPDQRRILIEQGISLRGVPILERPLGALTIFTPRQRESDRFSVGWVGRDHVRKRLGWFVEAIQGLGLGSGQLRVAMIGVGLGEAVDSLRATGVDCSHYDRQAYAISQYPQLYQGLDCIVITSSTEAGPLPLFEALATGLPAVSTPVGWAPYFSQKAPRYVRLANNPREITDHLKQFKSQKEEMFKRRFEIASLVGEWSLDTWLLAVLNLAGIIGRQSANGSERHDRTESF
jgi:glycosyltransferase involved in cell wall biosynthesis